MKQAGLSRRSMLWILNRLSTNFNLGAAHSAKMPTQGGHFANSIVGKIYRR